MQLIPECLKALKYSEFWEISENPSLLSFLEYRLHNNLGQEDTEHSRYKKELETILEYHDKTSEPGKIALQLLKKFQSDKRSREVNQFWELQAKRRNIISEFKLCEEKNKLNEKKQDELRDQICLEQTQLVLDTTKETRSQCVLLQKTVTKKRLLDEPSEKTYNDDDQYDKKTKLSNEGEGNEGYDEKYIETREIIADEENNPFLAPKKDVVENSDYNYDYSKDDVENSDHNEDVEDSDYNYDVLLTKALQSMNDDEKLIRGALFKILEYNKDEESRSGKNFMNSLFLNGIIDMANVKEQILLKLEGEQLNWLGNILNKKTWKKTQEFISFCNQFNEDNCDRVNVPVLVRKSFVPEGKFNSFSDEGHDIVQDIMKHFSVRLEAPMIRDSRSDDLERTYAIDTIVYIFNRLFRMHQDVLEWRWHIFNSIIYFIMTQYTLYLY
ncbi:hypothetical protein F8M41_006049 [Gigaspora margarita]|uniref:Uncharacterized protein n=1 Tax=Gigaspora margarita TaxID=4874 RepID=A0A8H3X9Q9_GIGMA|nr:hypothetical protein F8M41_006049 [Gigaspora margarita]